MRDVSIDSLQKLVRTFWGKSKEVRVFLRGGVAPPPHVCDLYRPPLWGLYVPSGSCSSDGFSLSTLAGWTSICRLPRLRMGGGVLCAALSFPPPPSPPLTSPFLAPPSSPSPSPGPSVLGML